VEPRDLFIYVLSPQAIFVTLFPFLHMMTMAPRTAGAPPPARRPDTRSGLRVPQTHVSCCSKRTDSRGAPSLRALRHPESSTKSRPPSTTRDQSVRSTEYDIQSSSSLPIDQQATALVRVRAGSHMIDSSTDRFLTLLAPVTVAVATLGPRRRVRHSACRPTPHQPSQTL